MVVQVDQELCAGCGVCVDECSIGAIQLADQRAVIDDALCTQCKECVDACPNGAIMVAPEPVYNTSLVALPDTETRPVLHREQPTPPQTMEADRSSRVALTAAATLMFVGREMIARLAEALIAALEHRFDQTKTIYLDSGSFSSQIYKAQGGGRRRQLRRRRVRAGRRNCTERR